MKASKSEVTYFILSIILIAFAGGIYLFFGNTKTNTSSSQPKSSISSSSFSQADLEAKAQELLSAAQANPSAEAVTNAQAAINKISDEAKKTDFQSQLDAVSAEVTNQTNAENAVKTAEDNQTSDNVTAAQAAIDVLTNQATKDQLQARLDAVSNAIAAANTATTNTATSSDDTTESTVDPNNTSRTPTSVTNDGTYTYYSY
ncbi:MULTISPECIES: peptidase [Streptococcus]|uniref:peptidase n=1 Tax=Streptococcus TaxID=1301 RepID=UPI000E8EA57D|nr:MULTISPECIES: peptidase [Streptococcus]MBT0897828.1 peptidase [Streptococcus lutetiensis]MBT0944784.1 peptidase [Streptococcus lutetiensis]MBT0949174.1 peptidase [Streptococcus lutetiensis]MBT1056698.1 peptidase [Streptococcus lutetiensis]MBT1058335.1 peptidase [Streptococcus lutetiensis]